MWDAEPPYDDPYQDVHLATTRGRLKLGDELLDLFGTRYIAHMQMNVWVLRGRLDFIPGLTTTLFGATNQVHGST